SQTVTITADDGKGGITATMFNLSVNNVPPSVSFSITANPIIENSSIALTWSIGDPGIRDSHSVVINWGDGSPATGLSLAAGVLSFMATHPYADDNPTGTASDVYPITVTVTDKDGATGGTSTPLTVNNAAPVISSVTGP